MKNKKASPKMTVIIPTRERADVFASALRTVTTQDYENLEILVSDNFSGDATEEIVRGIDDPRLKYLNTGKRISMTHNWEFALSHATGDWVTIIGDDDGLMPGALADIADLANSTGTIAIRSSTCLYRWPGHKARNYGRIRVPLAQGHQVRDCSTWMRKSLLARASYVELPMLYAGGFVSMKVINDIKRISGGTFYKSRIPDVYSAFAIASIASTYLYSYAPLAISGISKHSTGTDQFSKKGTKLEDSPAQKFIREENIPFHASVPLTDDGNLPPSPQAITFESYLQTGHLRSDGTPEPYDRQLELVLATSPHRNKIVDDWAMKFARIHGLNYEQIKSRALVRRLQQKLIDLPRNFSRRAGRRTLGSPNLPIENVYEGSLAAADFLSRRKR